MQPAGKAEALIATQPQMQATEVKRLPRRVRLPTVETPPRRPPPKAVPGEAFTTRTLAVPGVAAIQAGRSPRRYQRQAPRPQPLTPRAARAEPDTYPMETTAWASLPQLRPVAA